MEKLINEFSLGLFFWQALIFIGLLLLLRKFAWKPILKAVNDREGQIRESLELADKTKAEMKQLQAQNESLLKEAKAERDQLIKEASETAKRIVVEPKDEAKAQHDQIVADAQRVILAEKAAAITELKTTVASLSLEIAEKVIKGELASDDKQKALAEKLAEDITLN
ncbi:MAG: F0F1 ATP synthase subunit B [Flavobacteriales bacterium]|nr:F0F1 ATP synthase subunit B [Flavobacteriales bacterium]